MFVPNLAEHSGENRVAKNGQIRILRDNMHRPVDANKGFRSNHLQSFRAEELVGESASNDLFDLSDLTVNGGHGCCCFSQVLGS